MRAPVANTERRVDVVMPTFGAGGVQSVFVSIANGLADRGVQVRVLTFDPSGPKAAELRGVELVALAPSLPSRPVALARLVRALRRPDAAPVVVTGMFSWNVTVLVARLLSGRRPRVVISDHNPLLPRIRSGDRRAAIVRVLMRGAYPLADTIVAVSDGVREETASLGRRVAPKVVTIHNPVVDRLLAAKIAGTEAHPWLDGPDTPVVAALSRLVPVKNYAMLLDAFAMADGLGGTAKLVIIGDGPERAALEAQARSLGIAERVDLVGARDNPMPLLKKADLFVHTSDREGFGLVIVEALAAGVPVIATDCESGPADILADGRYGDLVPVGDREALAAAIDRSLTAPKPVDPEALDRYRIERIIDDYERVLFDAG